MLGELKIYHYTNFQWSATEFFARDTGWFQGFSTEPYDGEYCGFGVEGKTGAVEEFVLVVDHRDEAGQRVFSVSPLSPKLVQAGFTGGTIVCPA